MVSCEMKKMKVFTVCNDCNKEFELYLIKDMNSPSYFVHATACPHCGLVKAPLIRIQTELEKTVSKG